MKSALLTKRSRGLNVACLPVNTVVLPLVTSSLTKFPALLVRTEKPKTRTESPAAKLCLYGSTWHWCWTLDDGGVSVKSKDPDANSDALCEPGEMALRYRRTPEESIGRILPHILGCSKHTHTERHDGFAVAGQRAQRTQPTPGPGTCAGFGRACYLLQRLQQRGLRCIVVNLPAQSVPQSTIHSQFEPARKPGRGFRVAPAR